MATFEDQIKQKVLELASAGATEKEIDAFVSDAMSGRSALKAEQPETVSTITGMTPAQAQARAEAGMQALEAGTREFAEAVPPAVARYGVPVAAGMATAPLSFPAAAATMTGTLGLSELGAQALESMISGQEYRPGQVGAAMAFGPATPLRIAQTNKIFGLAADNLKAGQGVVNFLANAGLQTAASETARAIESDKSFLDAAFQAPSSFTEAGLRFGIPAVVSGIGTRVSYRATAAEQAAQRAEQLTKERFGPRYMLGELLEGYQPIEKKAISDGLPFVVERLNNLGADIGSEVVSHFAGAKNTEDVAKRLIATGAIGKLEVLQKNAMDAYAAKQAADAALEEAAKKNAADIPVFEAQARAAGVEAAKQYSLYTSGIDDVFGISRGSILVGASRRKEDVMRNAEAAKLSVDEGLDALYSASGIKINERVLTKDLMYSYLDRRIKDKNARQEIKDSIESAAKRLSTLIDDNGNISRSSFLRIRNEIAAELTKAGAEPRYANRVAAQAYGAIVDASEAYMKAADPTKLEALKKANKSARAVAQATTGFEEDQRESVIPLLQRGLIGDVVKIMESPSAKSAIDEINAYAAALRGMGDSASKAAANVFRAQTFNAIRDELVESSLLNLSGVDQLARVVDVEKLSKRLDALRRNKFPVERLNLGTSDEIATLSRLSNEVGMSVDQVNNFLNDAVAIGTNGAEARVRYQRAYVDYLTSGTPAEQKRSLTKLKDLARKGKIDYNESERLLAEARRDPLVQLFNSTDLNLNPDTSKNSRYSFALLDAGENNVKRLVDSLEGPSVRKAGLPANEVIRRAKLADDLRKSVARDVFFNAIEKSSGPGDKTLALQQVTNLFYGDSDAATRQRKSLIALIGKDSFNDLKDKFAKPSADILKQAEQYGAKVYDFRPETTLAASGVSMGVGAGQGGAGSIGAQRGKILGGWFSDISRSIRNYRINEAYLLFVDPEGSKAYRNAAYNLDRFLNSSQRNMMAYRLAQQQDDEATQGQPTR
jgi:hypothetical protein